MLRHRQGKFLLDGSFVFIEGHPRYGEGQSKRDKGWATRPNPFEYPGDTLEAQTTILLHEFAHTINLIPTDGANPGQSLQNTQTILDKCKEQINKLKK